MNTKKRWTTVPDWSPRMNASSFSWVSLSPNLTRRKKNHNRLAGKGDIVTDNSYSDTHHFISRSVAAISEVWTWNLSPPRNESGMYGSGGIPESGKQEMTEMGRLESGETCCPAGFLQTRTSPSDPLP